MRRLAFSWETQGLPLGSITEVASADTPALSRPEEAHLLIGKTPPI